MNSRTPTWYRRQTTILTQAALATFRRAGRSVITAIGVALGIAVFLTTVGLSATVNSEVNASFDRLLATKIAISDLRTLGVDPLFGPFFQTDVQRLEGVVAGGRLYSVVSDQAVYRNRQASSGSVAIPLIAADAGALDAVSITLASGRTYDSAVIASGQPVVVLGKQAATRLGIRDVRPGLAVEIGHTPVTVIGIVDSFGAAPELGLSVIVPPEVLPLLGYTDPIAEAGVVQTKLGAAGPVARALPLVVRPGDPLAVGVLMPPDPTSLRTNVQGSLNGMALGAAALSLLIGGIGIMNSMLMSVTQRSSEIGLRRALGGRPRHLVEQFVAEGTLIGAIGGVIGLVGGAGALIVIAAVNGWQPVLDHWLLWLAPPTGAVVGALASIYPSLRAASHDPATTLRR